MSIRCPIESHPAICYFRKENDRAAWFWRQTTAGHAYIKILTSKPAYSRRTHGNGKSLKWGKISKFTFKDQPCRAEKRAEIKLIIRCMSEAGWTCDHYSDALLGPLSDLALKRQGTPFGWCINRSRQCNTKEEEWNSRWTELTDSKTELG